MKAIFDHQFMDFEHIFLSPNDRGWKYGDGLFETILIEEDKVYFMEEHLTRLLKGAGVLKMETSNVPNRQDANTGYLKLKSHIGKGDARGRLTLWRESAGLFTPQGNTAHCLLSIEPLSSHNKFGVVSAAGFATEVRNYPSPTSEFKTLSSLKYVLAGIEKAQLGLEEIFILDQAGHISEALSANVFWVQDGCYFTPPLQTGCVKGIMRNHVMKILRDAGFVVEERLAKRREFMDSKHIFTTNSMAIRHIHHVEGKQYMPAKILSELDLF